jgi:histidinol-phosphate aminotransferase
MHRVRPPFEVSVPALAAGQAALGDARFYQRTLALTRREKHAVSERLQAMGLRPVESHTNFILVDLGRSGKEVADRLLEEGYIVRAGLGPQLENHIRITLGTRRQNRGLVRALERIIG